MQVSCGYCCWNTTVDKPIHERDHNDCQQLITKSHGRSWLDQILRKATPTCVKGKVTVYVTCQCSENSYFWRVSGCGMCSLVHSFNCLVYSPAYNLIPQHITLSCIQCLCRRNHAFLMRYYSPVHRTNNTFKVCCCLRNRIRNDISCELSAGRWFIWNIKVYFLPEIQARHHKSVQCSPMITKFYKSNNFINKNIYTRSWPKNY